MEIKSYGFSKKPSIWSAELLVGELLDKTSETVNLLSILNVTISAYLFSF